MRGAWITRRPRRPAILPLVLLLAGAAVGDARADRIVLRGGARIRGLVLPSAEGAERISVQTEALVNPIAYSKNQIVEVIPEETPLREYLRRRDATGPDAQAQFDLGRWLEDQDLPDYARLHFERAVAADPAFGPAHEKLGHVEHEGRWLTTDAMREAQGLVKHRGRWITRDELATIDAEAAAEGDRRAWTRRILVLRQAMEKGTPDRRREAEDQLRAFRDPAAIGPLIQAFANDPAPRRELLAEILGAIPGPEAAAALVGRILA